MHILMSDFRYLNDLNFWCQIRFFIFFYFSCFPFYNAQCAWTYLSLFLIYICGNGPWKIRTTICKGRKRKRVKRYTNVLVYVVKLVIGLPHNKNFKTWLWTESAHIHEREYVETILRSRPTRAWVVQWWHFSSYTIRKLIIVLGYQNHTDSNKDQEHEKRIQLLWQLTICACTKFRE